MKTGNENTELLFSYGTLRYEKVQLSTFGRRLKGNPDTLPGYFLKKLTITDQDVIQKSGEEIHSILEYSGNHEDQVSGVVFEVSPDELLQADKYEVDDYKRVKVSLLSGLNAWVYVEK